VAAYLLRTTLLRVVAEPLIEAGPVGPVDCVLILDGDRCYDRAVELLREEPARRLLVVDHMPRRLERQGILPPFVTVARRELAARGLTDDLLTTVPAQAVTEWDEARALRGWLDGQGAGRVAILCDRFHSRKVGTVFHKVLGDERWQRVRLLPVASRWYDENDWWRHKEGLLDLFTAYAQLGHVWACGDDTEEWREWDADAYEQTLSRRP
jgi:hypothetical protein